MERTGIKSVKYVKVLFTMICYFGLLATMFPSVGQAKPEKSPIRKCWSHPAAILPNAGLAADKSYAYYVSSNGVLHSIDVNSGNPVWTTEVGGEVRSPVLVGKRSILIISSGTPTETGKASAAYLRSISPLSGITNWRVELPAAENYRAGVTDHGIAVVSSRTEIISFDELDGSIKWKTEAKDGQIIAPHISGRQIAIATNGNHLKLYDSADGKMVASMRLQFPPIAMGLYGDSTAIVSDDRGGLFSIDREDSGQNWKFKAGGRVTQIRMVGGNVLAASADNFVYFISAETGNVIWKRRLPGRIASVTEIGNDALAVTVVGEPAAYIINTHEGKLEDHIGITGEDEFLLATIAANNSVIIALTTNGISGYSTVCEQEKSGK